MAIVGESDESRFRFRAELLKFFKVTTIGIENTLRTQVLSLLSHFWLTSLVPSIS